MAFLDSTPIKLIIIIGLHVIPARIIKIKGGSTEVKFGSRYTKVISSHPYMLRKIEINVPQLGVCIIGQCEQL
jgi:hypothetical protein